MNLVDKTEYTNMYIRAADVRSVLHSIFINNKYGFTSLLIKTFKEFDQKPFKLRDCPLEISTVPYPGMPTELEFDYTIKAYGFDNSNLDMRNVHAIIHVDVLHAFVAVLRSCIKYLYDFNVRENVFPDPTELNIVYNYLNDATRNTRSSVSMLCDLHIYMDHFTLII